MLEKVLNLKIKFLTLFFNLFARNYHKKITKRGNSLVVQWLQIHASTAGGTNSTSGWETKTLHAMQCTSAPHQKTFTVDTKLFLC